MRLFVKLWDLTTSSSKHFFVDRKLNLSYEILFVHFGFFQTIFRLYDLYKIFKKKRPRPLNSDSKFLVFSSHLTTACFFLFSIFYYLEVMKGNTSISHPIDKEYPMKERQLCIHLNWKKSFSSLRPPSSNQFCFNHS